MRLNNIIIELQEIIKDNQQYCEISQLLDNNNGYG